VGSAKGSRDSEELATQTITTVGLDLAKSDFQVHGIDAEGKVVLRRQLKRRYVLVFFQRLPPRRAGIEAEPRRNIGRADDGLRLAMPEAAPCRSAGRVSAAITPASLAGRES
jgi:hypothetical protein